MEAKKRSIKNHPVQCYGCSICAHLCPQNAISMKLDKKGFYYPYVEGSCVNCGICLSACPISHESEFMNIRSQKCIAFKNDDETRLLSSSGGIYTAISNLIIKKLAGYCVGVKYDDNLQPRFSVAHTETERDKHRDSKYIQPIIDNTVLGKIEDIVKQGKNIAISGSPCEIAGIKSLLKQKKLNTETVVFIDIVCHGVPSPKLWRDYLDALEKTHDSKAISYTFRDKTKGWRGYHVRVQFENGTTIEETDEIDSFVNLFKDNLSLRESCYSCPYTTLSRCGDITIGDFWGIENIDPEFSDNSGVSLVFANTTKGSEIINEINKVLEHRFYSSRVVIQPNLHKPSEVGMDNRKFWRLYKKRGYMAIRERFAKGGKRYFLYYYKKAIRIRLKMIKNGYI